MFDILFQILTFFKTFITFCVLSYIYKNLYTSCSEKKIIRTKDDKPKKVIKTKIGLSFVYLFLLTILYFSLTWYVMSVLILLASTCLILLTHKFEPSALDILKKYDSHPIVKKIWYVYSLVVNLVFKIMGPFHSFLENRINKNKQLIYEKFFERLTKKDFNPFDSLLNGGIMKSLSLFDNLDNAQLTENNVGDFSKMNNFFTKQTENEKLIVLNSGNDKNTTQTNDKTTTTASTKKTETNTDTSIEDFLNDVELKINKVANMSTTNSNNANDANDDTDFTTFINKGNIFNPNVVKKDLDENASDASSEL